MSWYVNYYLGVQDKDGKIVPLGPYDNKGKLKCVHSTSRSFTTDLKDEFIPILDAMITDELRKEFKYDIEGELRRYFEYCPIADLPKGEWIKTGYFLIEDINRYLEDYSDFDDFYQYLSPAQYAIKLENELKFGKPKPIKDCEGEEIEQYSCSEYAYFAYPDYQSKEYESWLLRTTANMLTEGFELDEESRIVAIKTEG